MDDRRILIQIAGHGAAFMGLEEGRHFFAADRHGIGATIGKATTEIRFGAIAALAQLQIALAPM